MFRPFTTALLEKIIGFLAKHPDFFEAKDRTKTLEKLVIPAPFKAYLSEVSEKQFMADVKLAAQYAKGAKGLNLKANRFFQAVAEFLTSDFARKLDLLDNEYYLFNAENRQKIAEKVLNSKSKLANTLRSILVNKTYQQISSAVYKLASAVQETSYILVQSPREISLELKKEIRKNIQNDNANNFPIFQINKKLIGGIRIFKDGENDDQSWLSRVLQFTSLTSA